MFDIRKKILIIAGVSSAVILVLLLLYLFVFRQRSLDDAIVPAEEQTSATDQQPIVVGQGTGDSTGNGALAVPSGNPEELYLRQLATIFVERFSSYSNQNDNKHIEDLLIMATDSMQNWMETQAKQQSNSYEGVATKAITSTITESTGDSAQIAIQAQQFLQKTGETTQTVYKNATVHLQKENTVWKVDGLYWEN